MKRCGMLIRRLKQKRPRGLAGKLVKFAAVFVLIMGILFLAMSYIQISLQKRTVIRNEEKRSDFVRNEYRQSMTEFAGDALLQLITWSSDKIDDEFWILGHDFTMLRSQVEDVYRHPDNYGRIPIRPPSKNASGRYSLQILYPEGAENADPKSVEMMERLANLAPLMQEIVEGNEGFTMDCYIASTDGLTLAMDDLSETKVDGHGNPLAYDPRTRPWFQGAVSTGDIYFSSRVYSYFRDFDIVVFGVPCYVDGKLVAVLQGSSGLDVFKRKLAERSLGQGSFSILVSHEGQLVCSTRTGGELKVSDDYEADIRDSVNPELKKIIDCALQGKTDVDTVPVDGELYYAGHAPIETPGWAVISFVPQKELLKSSEELLKKMDTATQGMIRHFKRDFRNSALVMILILTALLFAAILILSDIAKKRVAPINRMAEAVSGFTGEDMVFRMEDIYRTDDEIEVLALSFETMSRKMKEYIDKLVESTAERERLGAEMEAASRIQLKMLPKTEPDFKDKPGYELFADMVPAREVGGDLYDFFYLDEDHLALTIGDVSGKGISAALFMALSKQMLSSQLMLNGGDIVKAVTASNIKLCKESADAMFVTVWLGVLTISSGELGFVNAGHMYAAIKRAGGDFAIEPDEHGTAAGALVISEYKLNTVKLDPGDVVYLYTDGITEAHNPAGELFEEERLLNALNEAKELSLKEIDAHVRKRVADFSDGTRQYDDITTLCFRYLGEM